MTFLSTTTSSLSSIAFSFFTLRVAEALAPALQPPVSRHMFMASKKQYYRYYAVANAGPAAAVHEP